MKMDGMYSKLGDKEILLGVALIRYLLCKICKFMECQTYEMLHGPLKRSHGNLT